MQTIIIVLNPGKLENPNLDLRYLVPDRIEEVSGGAIEDDGYDYVDAEEGEPGPLMGIWMRTENAAEAWHIIEDLFRKEKFLENDLHQSAQIYISEKETEDLENCSLLLRDILVPVKIFIKLVHFDLYSGSAQSPPTPFPATPFPAAVHL